LNVIVPTVSPEEPFTIEVVVLKKPLVINSTVVSFISPELFLLKARV
jgi:hypothetical protein